MLGRFRALPFALAIVLLFAGSASALEVQTATVVVNHGNGRIEMQDTTARTVADFLTEQGIELGMGSVTPPAETVVTPGMLISINHPLVIYLQISTASGTNVVEWAAPSGTAVQDAVAAYSLETGANFMFDYSLRDRSITPFMTIALDLIQDTMVETNFEIAYEEIFEYTDELFVGRVSVAQEGIFGARRTVENVIFLGSEVIFNRVESDNVLSEPVDRVVRIGTQPLPAATVAPAATSAVIATVATPQPTPRPTATPVRANLQASDRSQLNRALNTNMRPTEYADNWRNFDGDMFYFTRRLSMEATAYHAGPGCTNKYPCHRAFGITASGLPARVGVVAVDPRTIPLLTKVYIVGYGFAITADTGSGVRGNIIDLFFNTIDECIEFGRRAVTVYVIEQFPDRAAAEAALYALNPYCRLEYFHGTCCGGINRWGNARVPNR